MSVPTALEGPLGFNVLGYLSGNLGLAVAARNSLAMLLERGERVAVFDFDAGRGRSGHDRSFLHLVRRIQQAPFGINLFHLNPPDIVYFLADHERRLRLSRRLNVCVPFWELPRLPERPWVSVLESCDLVLAPSKFVAAAVRTSAPRARVVHYPQSVLLPDGVGANRSRWALPAEATTFLVTLDLGSDIDRKNPFAAISAFEQAFGRDRAAHLVIKLNNARMSVRLRQRALELVTRVSRSPNVTVVNESLSYRDVISLYASCDVLVSLHRSEGLGLHMLECMALAKPVIATRWGGNLDFMDERCAALIDYDLVPVRSEHDCYRREVIGPGQVWAEPDLAQAAAAMAALADDAQRSAELGARARAAYLETRRVFLDNPAIETVIRAWRSTRSRGGDHAVRAAALSAARKLGPYRRTRRIAARVLRRLRPRR